MKDFCVECGLPHPSVFVYTDDKGEERFVHDRCLRFHTRRTLEGGPHAKPYLLSPSSGGLDRNDELDYSIFQQ